MSLKRLTVQALLDYDTRANQIMQADPGMYLILIKLLRPWYNDNGVRLQAAKDKLRQLEFEYFETEGEGNKTKIKIIPEKQETIPSEYKDEIIPNKWHQFGKPKTRKVTIKEAYIKKTPAAPVLRKGMDMETLKVKSLAITSVPVDINF